MWTLWNEFLTWLHEINDRCQHPACERNGRPVQVDDDFLGSPPVFERRCSDHLPAEIPSPAAVQVPARIVAEPPRKLQAGPGLAGGLFAVPGDK